MLEKDSMDMENETSNLMNEVDDALAVITRNFEGHDKKMLDAFTKIVMVMIKTVNEQHMAHIKKLHERIDKLSETKDKELQEIIDHISKLPDIFEKLFQQLPRILQERPEVQSIRREQRKELYKVIEHAYTDPLTGLYNRSHLNAVLSKESGRWVGMVLDIDHFKRINDTYGHDKGDEVLRKVARSIKTNTSASKRKMLPFRLGGEEIGILIKVRASDRARPEDELEFIKLMAEKLRAEIKSSCECTVSIGVASQCTDLPITPEQGSDKGIVSFKKIFGDENLYAAKQTGRDKVVLDKETLIASLKEYVRQEISSSLAI